jgi:predicted RecB family nuclease
MQRRDGKLLLSPTDLIRFQGCMHATALDLRHLNGDPELVPAEESPTAKLLQAKGDAHEHAFLNTLQESGKSVHVIDKDHMQFGEAVASTRAVLAKGPEYIYQAALSGGSWSGFADFLERVDKPSWLGGYSYETIDTKLKRSPAPQHVLQLVQYSDLLSDEQGIAPERIHVVLGNGERASLRLADYASYARTLRRTPRGFRSRAAQNLPRAGRSLRALPMAGALWTVRIV